MSKKICLSCQTDVTQPHCASQTSFVTPLFHHFRLFSPGLVSVQLAILLPCEAAWLFFIFIIIIGIFILLSRESDKALYELA